MNGRIESAYLNYLAAVAAGKLRFGELSQDELVKVPGTVDFDEDAHWGQPAAKAA